MAQAVDNTQTQNTTSANAFLSITPRLSGTGNGIAGTAASIIPDAIAAGLTDTPFNITSLGRGGSLRLSGYSRSGMAIGMQGKAVRWFKFALQTVELALIPGSPAHKYLMACDALEGSLADTLGYDITIIAPSLGIEATITDAAMEDRHNLTNASTDGGWEDAHYSFRCTPAVISPYTPV